MPPKYIRFVLLLYGLLNAALYSSLLPLWEGFDEEFHYGYVQYLCAHHRFPVLGPAALSLEINRSIGLLPMSYIMIRNVHLKGVRTFDEYFSLDSATRHRLYDQAHAIPSDLRLSESAQYYTNYEVHHAPLSYLLMAIPESFMWRVPLPWRVWIVRLLVSVACVVLMAGGMWALGVESGLRDFTAVLVFLVFSCQMFWATIAHIANDWLAVPLAVWLIVWGIRYHRTPSVRTALWLGAVAAAGLLTKAYFLVFVPLYIAALIAWRHKGRLPARALAALIVLPLLLAGPWYTRNLLIYGNITGRVEETNGVTAIGALKSLVSIPWLKSLPFMARGTFWMGNASFTDFSVLTMNALLGLLLIGLALYCRTAHRSTIGPFLWLPVLLFFGAMFYVTGSSYVFTKGEAIAASPWYLQAVIPALLCLVLLGYQGWGAAGRHLAAANAVLWGYILAATYVAKLFPLYGGFTGGRSTLREVARWYVTDWPRTSDILGTTAMIAAPWLVIMLVLLLATLLAAIVVVLQRIYSCNGS